MHQINGDHPTVDFHCSLCGNLSVPWRLTEALVTYTDHAMPGGKTTVTTLVCQNCEWGEAAEWPGMGAE